MQVCVSDRRVMKQDVTKTFGLRQFLQRLERIEAVTGTMWVLPVCASGVAVVFSAPYCNRRGYSHLDEHPHGLLLYNNPHVYLLEG